MEEEEKEGVSTHGVAEIPTLQNHKANEGDRGKATIFVFKRIIEKFPSARYV